ncbi:MAG: Gfo/Idh/MocA family protein, partial [Spirochaetia bacterium]
ARDPATGGGLFIDMLLHDFDTLRFLLNQEVESVFAEEANLVVDGQGIDRFADNAMCSLRFSQGALAQCHASMHAEYGYDVRAEVFGEHGMLQIGAIAQNGLTRFTAASGGSRPQTYLGDNDQPHFMQRFSGAYANEIDAFVDCIIADTPPQVTHHDALKAFEIALAASESARSGSPVTPG